MTPVRYPLSDDHRVYQLQALWQYEDAHLHGSRHVFVCLRSGGLEPHHIWQRWDDGAKDIYTAWRPDNWLLQKVVVSDLWPGTVPDWEHSYAPGYAGPHSGGPGTPGTATPLLHWLTGWVGKSHRGRTFWGPIREEDTDASFISSDPFDNMLAYAQMMMSLYPPNPPFLLDMADFVVLSRTLDSVTRPVPVASIINNARGERWMRTNRKRTVDATETEDAF